MIIIPPQPITVISSNAATSPDPDNPGYMFSSGMTDSEFLTTQTENADMLEVEITFNNCDRIALFNIDAYSVDFELTDNNTSSVVQTKTVNLAISGYDNEYQQWILEGMHIYDNATLKISINKDIPYHISAQRGTLAFPININIETAKIISINRLLNANANNHFITLRITAGVANKGNLLNKLLILSSFLFIFMIF